MAQVKNISGGPRGAYLKGELVMVEAGQVVEADDFNEEWFGAPDAQSTTADLSGMSLLELVKVAVDEGLIESDEVIRQDLQRAIESKREFIAAQARDDDEAAEPGPLDGSIEDLTEHLAGVEDVAQIQKLIDAETGGKSRKGALEALNARKAELEAE